MSDSIHVAPSTAPATLGDQQESEMNQTLYTAFDGLNQHQLQQSSEEHHLSDVAGGVFSHPAKAPANSAAAPGAPVTRSSSTSTTGTNSATAVVGGMSPSVSGSHHGDALHTPIKVLNLSTDSGNVTLRHAVPGQTQQPTTVGSPGPVNPSSVMPLSNGGTPYAVRRPPSLPQSQPQSSPASALRGINTSGASLNSSLDTTTSNKFASEEVETPDRHYAVVSRLDNCTTKKMLLDLFFPYGALDAQMLTNTSSAQGISNTMRRTGFVVFPSHEMSRLARDKMHQFIPCRQTLALTVHLCTLQEVKEALHRDSFAASLDMDLQGARPKSNTAKLGLLADMAGTTPANLASYIQSTADPEGTAKEVVDELDVCTPAKIGKYADALEMTSDMWPYKKHLQTNLVRSLLSAILQGGSLSAGGAQDELAPLNPIDHGPRRINAGHLLGLLFVNGFIPGDPYEVATRLLRSEITEVSQITAICKITELQGPSKFPNSCAGFWALIAEVTAIHSNPDIRFACSQRLTSRFVTSSPTQQQQQSTTGIKGLSPDAKPFQTATSRGTSPISDHSSLGSPVFPVSPLGGGSPMQHGFGGGGSFGSLGGSLPPSAGGMHRNTPQGKKAEEARSRTIYVSRLSPSAPAFRFREMLDSCGVVNRVRVCREQGYSTLFGFVELHSKEAARNLLRRDKELFYDSQVRFQPAKMPVQDEDTGDALIGPEGQRLRLCDFALHHPQSTSVAMLAAYMKARK